MQRARVCVAGTHTAARRVGACFTRGKKCCVIDFSVQPRGVREKCGGGRPRPEKPSAEKNRDEKAPLPF